MNWSFLKSYLPRSLFWRTMLILLAPVLGVEIVVGNIFIQRHFAQVTEQMSRSIGLEVALAAADVDEAADVAVARERLTELSVQLQLLFTLEPESVFVAENARSLFDLSGAELIKNLSVEVGRPVAIDLVRSNAAVDIRVDTNKGLLVIGVPRSRVSATNPHQLLVWMITVSLVLIIIAALFLRNQIKPIRRLSSAAEAFGKGQMFEFRPTGSVEIRRAGHAFVAMRHRIERQIEQRQRMLSAVSHDLRTPLTRLKLSLAMQEGDAEAEAMNADVDAMERMLDELLAHARGESVDVQTNENIPDLLEEVVSASKRQGINITVVCQTEGSLRLTVRKYLLTRAIQNLVDNAGKYASQVCVTLSADAEMVHISVEDNGPGIPEKRRDEAMKPFARLDRARKITNRQGVGLGLAIAQDIAHIHGGNITLGVSETLGGLEAELSLPR